MEEDGFIDRSQRFSYLLACENARRIADDPSILAGAAEHLERFAGPDPRQREGYRLWRELLDGPAEQIVALLTELSRRGDYARETAPAFPGMPVSMRTRLLGRSRAPLPELTARRGVPA
jgi:hypothetical protein